MFTTTNETIRRSLGTTAAVCVMAIAGLALEFGHAGALPAGTVEVGELQPVNLEQLAAVTLPGIVVTAARLPVDAKLELADQTPSFGKVVPGGSSSAVIFTPGNALCREVPSLNASGSMTIAGGVWLLG